MITLPCQQIYLEETMIETIKKLARERELTQSEIIREAILKYIQEEQVKGKVVDPVCRTRKIANVFGFDREFNTLGFLLSPFQVHEEKAEYHILKP